MRNFDKIFDRGKRNDSRGGDFKRRDSSRKSFGSNRDRPQMHEAICDECGKKCEVPFRPTGDKPVFCSECYSKREGGSSRDGGFSRDSRPSRDGGSYRESNLPRRETRGSDRPRFQDRQRFDAVCSKCGKKFDLPFEPTREVYCDECFKGNNAGTDNNQLKNQIDSLNVKFDKIIQLLTLVVEKLPTKIETKIVKDKVLTAPIKEKVISSPVKEKIAITPKKEKKKIIAKKKDPAKKTIVKKVKKTK
jgi:CxxC-x17-CxxC domain-containing protein